MLRKDIGTVMHLKKLVNVTFVYRVVCYSATIWVRFGPDFYTIWRISSTMNVLSHSIAHIVQQKPIFNKCRNILVIG